MFKMNLSRSILWLSTSLVLLAVACEAPPSTEGESPLGPPPSESPALEMDQPAGKDAEMVKLAKQDLADRLQIGTTDIELVEVTAVEWPDASLGCPVEGQSYAQVVTSGLQVTLRAEGSTYTYNTGMDSFVLCSENAKTAQPDSGPTSPAVVNPQLADLTSKAIQDLSARLGMPVDQIQLDSAEAVQWRDSSLGCPMPGQSYLTVIIPGYLVRLRVDDNLYEYHTDNSHRVVYCPRGTATADRVRNDADAGKAIAMVTEALAEKLSTRPADIQVVSVRAENWPTAALGCPQPGMAYADVLTPGFLVVLSAGGGEYVYHTGSDNFVLCRAENSQSATVGDHPTQEPDLDPTLANLVQLAKKDLSTRHGIPFEQISLKTAEKVDWRDSSLGCPEVGTAYLTVITPGYLILLDVNGRIYEYHADYKRVVTCDNPQAPLEH